MTAPRARQFAEDVLYLLGIPAEDVRAVALAAGYFFCILSAYYVIRPIRDQMGVAGGVENLPWLWTGTLIAVLIVHPLFTALVGRYTRRRFVAITYRFFMVNLVVFFLLLRGMSGEGAIWLGRAFYVWTSVFNLFIVSVFWAFMADAFSTQRSKRVFGLIGVGGTLGALLGSTLTAFLVEHIGLPLLLWFSIGFLELAVRFLRGVAEATHRLEAAPGAADADAAVIGGSTWQGVGALLRSPYLLGIAGYMFLFTLSGTVLYFQTAGIVERAVDTAADRTAFFARIDVAVNALTVLTQLLLTGRIIRTFGVAVTLAILPAVCVVGFTVLGAAPTVTVIVVFTVLRRAVNFAVAGPTRETLYTVIPRDQKYKAKNFVDTFVYRAGDQLGAWSYQGLVVLGLATTGIAFATVPLALAWVTLGYWLGRRQQYEHDHSEPAASVPAA